MIAHRHYCQVNENGLGLTFIVVVFFNLLFVVDEAFGMLIDVLLYQGLDCTSVIDGSNLLKN